MSLRQTLWGVETAAQRLAHEVVHKLPVTVATVALWDRPSFSLTVEGASSYRECNSLGAVGSRILLSLAPWHRQALEQDEPLLVGSEEKGKDPTVFEVALPLGRDLKWAYLIPLRIDGEQIGVLGLGEMRSSDREPLTEEKQARCRAIMDEFRSTWGQVWEVARLRRQIRTMSPVLRMVGPMLEARSYQDVLACCALEIADWLGTPVRAVLLLAGSGRGMSVAATWNLGPPALEDGGQLLMALAREAGSWQWPVRITRVAEDPLDPFAPSTQAGALWNRVELPLLSGDRVLGMVCLYIEDDLKPTEWDLELFRRRAEIVAVGVEVVTALEEHQHEVEQLSRTTWDLLSTHRQAVAHQTLAGIMELTSSQFAEADRAVGDGEDVTGSAAIARFGAKATQELTAVLSRLQEAAASGHGATTGPLEVNQLVRQALVIARAAWDEAPRKQGVNLVLTFEPHAEPMLVGTSAAALIGAVVCAIENAVEALPDGGRINVRTARDNGHAVIAVADSGPGVVESQRERAFAPFFSTKGKSHVGLGLSVARALASRYGGEATLTSSDGGGATLLLRLPISTA